MSREVVVLVRCDSCGATADEGDGVTEAIPITFGKESREIDLCAKCAKQALGDIGPWLDCARKVPKRVVKKTTASASNRPPTKKVPCPTCRKPFAPNGVAIHRARKHGYRGKR